MRSIIVGTAGHIDHGKTSLVRALTGIDTDRLEEEKRRGISIDLGFAHLALGADLRIGFVDVPGHERFVRNMLAGAGGIDLALMVVAATESIKPQTREHFDICRLLGIQSGLVAVTKADLADADMIELVKLEVEELTAGTFLAGKPIIPVSTVTGAGLEDVKKALKAEALAVKAKSSKAWFRMPIDRAFSMKGFGSVVTGTLAAGEVRVDDEVTIYPEKRPARVRGVQVHGATGTKASAGQRTALNLAGVDLDDLRRGQVLAAPVFQAVTHLDTRLTLLASAKPLRHRAPVHFHTGTAECEATAALVDGASELEPGQEAFVRFTLSEPVLILPGDRFIIRMFSPVVTIGGGVAIEINPPRRPNTFATRIERMEAMRADPAGTLIREAAQGIGVAEVIARTGLKRDEITGGSRLFDKENDWLLDPAWLAQTQAAMTKELAGFHQANPLLPGLAKEELRARTLAAAPSHVFTFVLGRTPAIVAEAEVVRLAAHRVVMQSDESGALAKIEALFADAGLAVPAVAEVLGQSGVDQKRAQTLLATLLRERKLIRVSQELVYHATAIAALKALLTPRKGQRFAVPEFKDWTGVSRKYAIPLLEFLDRERLTRREGDQRVIV